jgi:hypothetical protein
MHPRLLPGFVDAHTHLFNDAVTQGLTLDEAHALGLSYGYATVGDLSVDRDFLGEMIQPLNGIGSRIGVRTGIGSGNGRWHTVQARGADPSS